MWYIFKIYSVKYVVRTLNSVNQLAWNIKRKNTFIRLLLVKVFKKTPKRVT